MKPKPERGLCPILSTVYGDVEVNNLDVGEACYSKFRHAVWMHTEWKRTG